MSDSVPEPGLDEPAGEEESVRVLFSLAHRPKDPGPNSWILVDWAWLTASKWGLITNQVVRKSHKSPQGKNAIPPGTSGILSWDPGTY